MTATVGDINAVIAKGMEDLITSGMTNTAMYVAKNGCFMSRIKTDDGEYCTVIDFTTPMTYDKLLYANHTVDVYKELVANCMYWEL